MRWEYVSVVFTAAGSKRHSVLAADDMNFWRDIVIDLMSDEEGGTFKGSWVSRWIAWPPCFHNLWSSLTCVPHFRPDRRLGHRRLHIGAHSDRMPPNTHDPEMAKKDTTGFDVMPTLIKLNPLKPAAPPPHPTQQHRRAEDKMSAGPERKTGGGFYFVLFKSFVFLWF